MGVQTLHWFRKRPRALDCTDLGCRICAQLRLARNSMSQIDALANDTLLWLNAHSLIDGRQRLHATRGVRAAEAGRSTTERAIDVLTASLLNHAGCSASAPTTAQAHPRRIQGQYRTSICTLVRQSALCC